MCRITHSQYLRDERRAPTPVGYCCPLGRCSATWSSRAPLAASPAFEHAVGVGSYVASVSADNSSFDTVSLFGKYSKLLGS